MGGGLVGTASQVAAQAYVPHEDVAMATATVLLLTGIGGAFGAAIGECGACQSPATLIVLCCPSSPILCAPLLGCLPAGAVWSEVVPQNLRIYLPTLSDGTRAELFGNISAVLGLARDDPVRAGVIRGANASIHLLPRPLRFAIVIRVAYVGAFKTIIAVGTTISVAPIFAALLMPSWYLGEGRNAVE